MTEISIEERSRQYQAHIKQQREAEAKKEYIRRIVTGTDGHDRKTCNCDGCMWWWRLNVVLNKEGQFMEVLPSIRILLKEKGIHLYMRDFILQLRRVESTGSQPIWIAYNESTNKKLVYNEI